MSGYQSFKQLDVGRASSVLVAIWAIVGSIIAIYFDDSDWQATFGVLMISQAFTGWLVWHRIKATRKAVLPDFLTLALLTQFGTKVLTALGIYITNGMETENLIGDTLQSLDSVPLVYKFQAELVFLLATIVFTTVWKCLEGSHILAIWNVPRIRSIWLIYGLSLVMYVVAKVLAIDLGAFGDFLYLAPVGAIALLLGGSSAYALGNRRSVLAILALAPTMVFALNSGMKGEFALVMWPILLPILRRMTLHRFAFLGGVGVFVVLFLFPFNNAWREANWFQNQRASVGEVASRVVLSWEQVGFLETSAVSTAQWLSRGSSADIGGLVMQMAEQDGLLGPVLIEGLTSIFVPRILWPSKPNYIPGAWFTWYLGKADSPETATTATAMMLPTELYWMFGLMGVVLGMAFISFLYFKVWRFLVQASTNRLIPAVALFVLIARSSGMEEVHTIYAVSSPIILVVYVLIFDWLQRTFFASSIERKSGVTK